MTFTGNVVIIGQITKMILQFQLTECDHHLSAAANEFRLFEYLSITAVLQP